MEFLLPLILAVSLPEGLDLEDTLELEHGTEFVGAVVPEEVPVQGTLELELYFKVDAPLDTNVLNFVHLESQESKCRMVRDIKLPQAEDGIIAQRLSLEMPVGDACHAQRLEIYTGLYNRRTGQRFALHGTATTDDRIHAAYVHLVEGEAQSETQALSPSDMKYERIKSILQPWWGWIWGLIAMILLAVLLRWLSRRFGEAEPEPVDPPSVKRWWVWVPIAALALPLLASLLIGLDFIKDDAYISFRYAHNLVNGDGFVFNTGDRLEGFTNFLWTLLLAPFEAMGLDLFQVTEILGGLLALGFVAQLVWLSFHFSGGGPHRSHWHLWAGLWIATSSSVALWTTSGMEQPLAMMLPLASAYLLWRNMDDEENGHRGALWSGVLIGLGCMTRPEIHLIGILLGLPLVWRVIRERRIDRVTRYWFLGLLGVTVPFHAFRLLYFGGLMPNTYYVKTGGSVLVMIAGVKKLHEMFDFNNLGYLVMFVPLAFLNRKYLREKLVLLGVSVGFMAFVVKVGVDEMRWHRLYLPALPFLVLLASLGLRNLCEQLIRLARLEKGRIGVYSVAWVVVLLLVKSNLAFTYEEKAGFNGRGELSGNFHPDMGKFLVRHDRPGALAAFQDMGSTPYHAPDINFLDFIGLVDGTVAHARHDYGLHAFIATESHRNQSKYNADMRAYFYERNPEWVILTSYIPGSAAQRIAERFGKAPVPRTLEPWIGTNSYQFGIYNKRFKDNYVHVRTWPRSATYYLSLFRRKDLWEQIPGEVVLDGVPEGLGGVTATFDGKLELLGSEMETEATTGQEAFITTWWRLPGKMRDDLFFFLHMESEGFRVPYDYIPGDWMYPADRWRPGQILENRVLLQIPPFTQPGTYQVYLGAYLRRDGKRLDITTGPNDGQNRLLLGEITVRPFKNWREHIILPTDVEVQRKYPDRIIDHGRD